ncbi:hypothetical protein IWX90DRAFT_151677 [Phyllosticta citrichinensis]|uniref:Secreted protein n=1 Tax=Phyllosticta citrichinensis TaxID=1130410 RepID=A0ABR1XZZ4_9PEZI
MVRPGSRTRVFTVWGWLCALARLKDLVDRACLRRAKAKRLTQVPHARTHALFTSSSPLVPPLASSLASGLRIRLFDSVFETEHVWPFLRRQRRGSDKQRRNAMYAKSVEVCAMIVTSRLCCRVDAMSLTLSVRGGCGSLLVVGQFSPPVAARFSATSQHPRTHPILTTLQTAHNSRSSSISLRVCASALFCSPSLSLGSPVYHTTDLCHSTCPASSPLVGPQQGPSRQRHVFENGHSAAQTTDRPMACTLASEASRGQFLQHTLQQ